MRQVRSVAESKIITEMGEACLLMRMRLISRVVTTIYDEELRTFGIGSPQLVLLGVIAQIEPATRAEIGRFHYQDRSTLTRNLKLILISNWAEEIRDVEAAGRGRPVVVTKAGRKLLVDAAPAWRKAQVRTKALLGGDGVKVVTNIANELQNG